ncbi:MAG: multicopper oxidase family protein [Gemmatimonadaceae bacterium]
MSAPIIVALEARATEWEIAPEKGVEGWGYNGQIPGPTIKARVGDTLVIRLKNSLPEPTTIHWHGLRIQSDMDGTDSVQRAVAPGETYEYRFELPDAGTFWYHSHMNETEQMERGLYGAMVVRGSDDPVVDDDRVLVLDDLMLDGDGQIAAFGGLLQRHNGRIGNTRLVNGCVEPELLMSAGHVERWRVVNAASARYVRLSVGGKPFRLLATDGGFLDTPVTMNELLLVPGERADILVGPFAEGETFSVDSISTPRNPERFASVRVGRSAQSSARIPARLNAIESLVHGNAQANRTVHFQSKLTVRRGIDWLVNDEMHHHAPPVTLGELQVWDIVNETRIDHPFHLHGFFFQVIEVAGVAPPFRAWRDTVNVQASQTVRIAWMPDDRPGEWMYHCHILEHHAAGMMAHFQVLRAGEHERVMDNPHHAAHR